MSNKGLVLRFCKECKRKRFCSKIPVPGYNFRYTCSKGHSWIIKGVTIERINAAFKDVFIDNKLMDIFERDDTFYRSMK